MNKIQIILIKIVIPLLLCLNGIDAWASKPSERKWSFEFENISVKEALIQISEATGVTFAADEQALEKAMVQHKINKSYQDQYLDKIIQDVFRKDNCAFTWLYKNNQLNYVEIWLIESENKKSSDGRITGGPDAFKDASSAKLSGARPHSPAKQGFRKMQRKFDNSGERSFSRSRRTTKGQKDAHFSSIAADSNSDTVSQAIADQKTDFVDTSDNSEDTTESLESYVSSEIAESTESTGIKNSADASSWALKTDTLALISQTENGVNPAKSDMTDANQTEYNIETTVPKAESQNNLSDDNPDSPPVVSKVWLVEQMQNGSEPDPDEPDGETVYKTDAEMP